MKHTLYTVLFFLSSALPSFSQSGTTTGIVPFGSYTPVEAGTVNLSNLSVLSEIPFPSVTSLFRRESYGNLRVFSGPIAEDFFPTAAFYVCLMLQTFGFCVGSGHIDKSFQTGEVSCRP